MRPDDTLEHVTQEHTEDANEAYPNKKKDRAIELYYYYVHDPGDHEHWGGPQKGEEY